ncbi:MAG: ABC transporter ATP-binding protein [Clostridia bacterium]|nr:ABC transporter ATP-binding protein [Clostridia bacterium]
MKKSTQMNSGKIWLKNEIRPYGAFIVFLTVLTVLSTVFSLAFAYMVRYLINSATNQQATRLWIFAGCLLGLLLFRIALKTWTGYLSEKLRTMIFSALRVKTFSAILRSDYAKINEYHSGELMNRLTSDISEVSATTAGLMPAIAGMVAQTVGAIVALLTIDPWFTLIYIVCGGIFCGLFALFRKQLKQKHKEVMESDGQVRSFMQEGLGSIMTVKAYSAEGKYTDKAQALTNVYYDKRMKRNVLRSCMNGFFNFLSNFGLIFAVVWCGVSVLNGKMDDYGAILSVILLLMQFQQPLSGFSSLAPAYYARLASSERLLEISELDKENVNAEQVDAQYDNLSAIRFENVGFTYGRETVLENASATIEKGKIVCLTGASGAGKSTLFKLLLRVFRQNLGEISLVYQDGERELTEAYRGLFAYVPQGNFLFSGTIRENLVFFNKETLDEEKIKSALRVACADFVYDLPDGLNTMLLEAGSGLSEGQRQRLAVARAILSNRPILLLDEATSALDTETESALLENLRALNDRTCLIVTHRPAALEIADNILNIEKGRIIQVK